MAVYFIRCGDTSAVKIGTADNVDARLRGLQCAHSQRLTLARVMPGSFEMETLLHHHYADRHIRGEWFEWSEDMLTVDIPDIVARMRKLAMAEQEHARALEADMRRKFGVRAA